MRRVALPLFFAAMFAAGFAASFPWADKAEKFAHASSVSELRIAGASLSNR
jgi:hypothetical protein